MTWFFRVWWISLIIKIILASILPLASDEAYYWFWSHHLEFSYFDHPPGVALLIWLGQPFENLGSAVRIPGVLLGHLTLLIWWQLLKDRMSKESLQLWLALSLLTPFTGFGSLVITPDLPVLFFWALSLLAFERALQTGAAKWYAALGLAMGLGFSSKYHIVLMVPIFLLYLSFSKQWKSVSLRFVPLTVLTGLLGSAPVLYWNATHDWISFRFQLNHGFGRSNYDWEWTLGYIAGQVVLMGAVLLPSLVRGIRSKQFQLFSWNAIFIWAFFLYSSFKSVVEANWPIVAFPAAHALIAKGTHSAKWMWGTCVFWTVLAALLLSHWAVPWIPGAPEKMNETHHYASLAPLVDRYSPLYANTYQMASLLSFLTKKQVLKLSGMSRYDYFDQMPESKPNQGNFYLIRRTGEGLPDWLSKHKAAIEVVETSAPDFELLKVSLP